MTNPAKTDPRELSGEYHVLVVDDVQDNLDLMVDVLDAEPYRLSTAGDAAEALRLTAEVQFDLFILDVRMPKIDGFELCRRLRQEPATRDVPVIFVTAERTAVRNVIEGLDAGGFDYITKPVDRGELLARVRVMLRLRRMEKRILAFQDALLAQNERLEALNSRLMTTCMIMHKQRAELSQKARELTHASRVKNEFLAKMSHELRTPMNSITGFTDLMATDRKEPPSARQAARLEKVGRNARRLLALINDILDLSKIEAMRFDLDVAPVNVPEVVDDCVELIHPLLLAKPVTLSAKRPTVMRNWEGDEVRLRQIITNLLSNAVKFTDTGRITVTVIESSEGLRITVSDDGIGIAPEHLPYVFDPFRQVDSSGTRRASGTGLGLTICHSLCRLMGGAIEVRSELGVGSTFEVVLPWRVEQTGANLASPSTVPECAVTRTLLLCSADPGTIDLTQANLANYGVHVRAAEDLDSVQEAVTDESPDGVLIDVRLPAAVAVLRRFTTGVSHPVHVWLTAWTEDHQLGCVFPLDAFIADPDDEKTLEAVGCTAGAAVVFMPADETRAKLVAALTRIGRFDIRAVDNPDAVIRELSSGDIAALVVDLCDTKADLVDLLGRIGAIAEWASVRIVGVIPPPVEPAGVSRLFRAEDASIREHGIATPALLLDIAESLVAECNTETLESMYEYRSCY